jgi:5-carboxymethyl-2-hydroxymuconate isomerase
MPHITIECSANVRIDFKSFFKELSDRLVATGNAARLGIKCRVLPAQEYFIVDGNEEYKMVNLMYRLREGRTSEILSEFSEIGMTLMKDYFQEDVVSKTIILSTEIKELKKGQDITFNAIR